MSGSDDDPTRIEQRIAESRRDIAEALAALDRRLSPRHVADDAVKIWRRAIDTMDGPKIMIDIVKRHPVPAALIAAGIGWAMFDAIAASGPRRAVAEPDLAGGTDAATPGIADLATPATVDAGPALTEPGPGDASPADSWRDAPVEDWRSRLRSAAGEQPLAVGVLGLLAGALLGTVLPLMRRDRAWQRASQDWLEDQAEGLGRDALDIAEAAGRAAIDVVRQELVAAAGRGATDRNAGDHPSNGNGARKAKRRSARPN